MIVAVDPGELHLPPTRRSGADRVKLAEQIRRHGDRTDGMLPVQVTLCGGGEMMINDGVTRATRVATLRPGDTIMAEVIDERPTWNLAHLPRVKETI